MDKAIAGRDWRDGYWESADGLRLHYRDYSGAEPSENAANTPLPVLCLHGLTRTCRDYEALAPYLAGDGSRGRRVIVPDLRGHGASEYAREPAGYSLEHFSSDIALLLAELELSAVAVIGTSLGGILTMRMAAASQGSEVSEAAAHIRGAVINDIGPQIEAAGLKRISENAGLARSYPTWMHAARALMTSHRLSFPRYDIQRWITLAKRNMVVGQNGRIMPDYDLAVAEPLGALITGAEAEPALDLWPDYEALSVLPLVILRGALSDILSAATFKAMATKASSVEAVEIEAVGHTPALDEALALRAIDSLLARID